MNMSAARALHRRIGAAIQQQATEFPTYPTEEALLAITSFVGMLANQAPGAAARIFAVSLRTFLPSFEDAVALLANVYQREDADLVSAIGALVMRGRR